MSRVRPRRASSAGFTLIELVVVLFVVAAVVAVALPSIGRSTEGLRLRREANRVAALVRTARLQAVTEQRSVQVSLDAARGTVALLGGGTPAATRELAVGPGVALRAETGGGRVTFSPRGLARPVRWILESPSGRRFVVEVADVGGRVRVGPDGTTR